MPRAGVVKVEIGSTANKTAGKLMLWSKRAGNIRPLSPVLAEYVMRSEAKLFDSEGASAGHPWSALADATRETKERKGLDPHIMRASDTLRNALAVPGEPDQQIIPGKTTFIFRVGGEPGAYGSIHQRTGEPGKPVDLSKYDLAVLNKIIGQWISKGAIVALEGLA